MGGLGAVHQAKFSDARKRSSARVIPTSQAYDSEGIC